MEISMRTVGNGSVLAGAVNGKAALRRLLEMASAEPEKPEPLFLDFAGIDVATASYLREPSCVSQRHPEPRLAFIIQ